MILNFAFVLVEFEAFEPFAASLKVMVTGYLYASVTPFLLSSFTSALVVGLVVSDHVPVV